MWDVICVTCSTKSLALYFQNELELYQKKGLISENAEVVAVEDPRENLGSGGATFNAILTIAELLSSKKNYAVINVNCMLHSRVLIMHVGHPFYGGADFGRRALITLPCTYSSPSINTCVPNFIHTYLIMTNHIAVDSPAGTWVVSTDMILAISDKFYTKINWSEPIDMLGLAVPMPVDSVAEKHGAYFTTPDGYVAELLYKPTKQKLAEMGASEEVLTLLGVVYLKPTVVESICSLYEIYPLISCTYVGVDSGVDSLNLSLFMDVMRASAQNLSQEDFVSSGDHLVTLAKTLVYQHLHKYKYKIVTDSTVKFLYPEAKNPADSLIECLRQFVDMPMASLPAIYKTSLVNHSINDGDVDDETTSIITNSYIGNETVVGESAVICHCNIDSSARVTIGCKSFVSGLEITLQDQSLIVPDEMVLFQYRIRVPSDKAEDIQLVSVIFGIHDCIMESVDEPTATFCNIPWKRYLEEKDIDETDLWPISCRQRSLFTARLFPIKSANVSLGRLVSWLAQPSSPLIGDFTDKNLRETWQDSWRVSLAKLLELISHSATADHNRRCYAKVAAKLVQRQLANNETNANLFNWYNTAVIDGFAISMLSAIDEVTIQQASDEVKLARLFANTAALLGCMSGGRGGLRSGPAGNLAWRWPFALLKSGNFEKAIAELAKLRSEWLVSPQLIIRAARHYEGAQQQMIAKATSTVLSFVHLRPGFLLIPIGRWVLVESPCRADFAGGWSDTPPVCYELGGAVVGTALMINGSYPIGAKARKIAKPYVSVSYLDSSGAVVVNWVFREISHLYDYDSPFSQAALVKACLVTAGIIEAAHLTETPSTVLSLPEQILATCGAPGLEICLWSNLPQGSGLGTSSILSGDLIAALWTIRGLTFDASSVIHAVLQFEQLLTTGGGWQDQVHGLVGGIKLAYSNPGLPLHVRWNTLNLKDGVLESFNKRFLLLYSGKTRLAKNVLQNVIRNWYSNDPVVVGIERELIELAKKAASALEAGDFDLFGSLVKRSYNLKLNMAPGSETDVYRKLMDALGSLASGYAMTGAGGGGFFYFILKDDDCQDKARQIIRNTPGLEDVMVYESEVATNGMLLRYLDD